MIKPTTHTQPILSHAGSTRLVVGNWSLISRKEGEITIHNTDGQQVRGFYDMKMIFSV